MKIRLTRSGVGVGIETPHKSMTIFTEALHDHQAAIAIIASGLQIDVRTSAHIVEAAQRFALSPPMPIWIDSDHRGWRYEM